MPNISLIQAIKIIFLFVLIASLSAFITANVVGVVANGGDGMAVVLQGPSSVTGAGYSTLGPIGLSTALLGAVMPTTAGLGGVSASWFQLAGLLSSALGGVLIGLLIWRLARSVF